VYSVNCKSICQTDRINKSYIVRDGGYKVFLVTDKTVLGMALIRLISALIEFSAAILFLKYDSIEKALRINAALALVGPLIMTAVAVIGLAGLSGKISPVRFCIILAGVGLIFIGVSKGR